MIIDVCNVDSSIPLSVWLAYIAVSIWTKGSNLFHPFANFDAYITVQFEGSFPEIYPCLWLYYHSNLNT